MVIQQALFLKVTILTPRFILSTILAWITHTGDSTQPLQIYAGSGENCDCVIAVNYNRVKRTFWNFLFILCGFVSIQMLILSANKKISICRKYLEKDNSTLLFGIFFTQFLRAKAPLGLAHVKKRGVMKKFQNSNILIQAGAELGQAQLPTGIWLKCY